MSSRDDLLTAFASSDPAARKQAYIDAGRLAPDPELLAALVKALEDPGALEYVEIDGTVYEPVNADARTTLVRWGAAVRPAVPELLRLAEHGPRWARGHAAEIACRIDAGARDHVVALLARPEHRTVAIDALAAGIDPRDPTHARYIAAIARCLADPDPAVLFGTSRALTQLRGETLPAAYVGAMAMLHDAPALVNALAPRAAEAHAVTDLHALRALGCLVGHRSAADALARIVLDTDHWAAASALADVGPVASDELFTRLLARLHDAPARPPGGLVRAIAQYGTRAAPAVPALLRLLEEPSHNDDVRSEAASALARLLPTDAAAASALRDRLIRLVIEGDDDQARLALGVVGADRLPRDLVPSLVTELEVPARRDRALRALAAFGPGAAPCIPALATLVTRTTPAPELSRVVDVIRALGAAALPVLPALLALLRTPHEVLALIAIEALGPGARAQAEDALEALRREARDRSQPTLHIDRALAAMRG